MKAEDFSCSLDGLYGGLGICRLQFLRKKKKKIVSINFFQCLIMKTLVLDPDPHPHPHRDPHEHIMPDPYSDPH